MLIFEISVIRLFYEFVDNGNLTICEILKFGTFLELLNSEIFSIFQIEKLKKFQKYLNFETQNLIPKIGQFWNCVSIQYSALLAISLILIFAL